MMHMTALLTRLHPFKRCLLCQQSVADAQAICAFCQAQLPWITDACTCCGVTMSAAARQCGQCRQQPPQRTRTVCAFEYAFPVQQMITGFKFEAQFFYLPPLLAALHDAVLQHYQQDVLPTALLAVPLHRKRQQDRGFNQAHLIAEYLQKKLKIPLLMNAVHRNVHTAAQAQLSARERQKNLQHAFEVKRPALIQQQHIAIIDDVITTGSTVETLAQLLLDHGATRIDAWSLARALN